MRPSSLLAVSCALALTIGCAAPQDYTGAWDLVTINNRHLPGDTSAVGAFILAETLMVSMSSTGEQPVARVVTHMLRRDSQNIREVAKEEVVASIIESPTCPQNVAVLVEDAGRAGADNTSDRADLSNEGGAKSLSIGQRSTLPLCIRRQEDRIDIGTFDDAESPPGKVSYTFSTPHRIYQRLR